MNELLAPFPLTPDLSRSHPDLYRNTLIDLLDQNTRYGKAAFDFIKLEKVSNDKITFNPDKWQSGCDMEEGTIMLGTSSMTSVEKDFNFPFETNTFNDEKVMVHKFAHEISHFFRCSCSRAN